MAWATQGNPSDKCTPAVVSNLPLPLPFASSTQILVDDSGLIPLIKLRAFHLSKDRVHDSAPVTQCGTALFSAPEVFLNVTGQPYDGQAVDIWSCGVVSCREGEPAERALPGVRLGALVAAALLLCCAALCSCEPCES